MRKTVLLYPAVRLTALLLSVCFLLTSVFPCITYAGNSDNGPAITSPAAILMEASTGQVIYEKDADTVLHLSLIHISINHFQIRINISLFHLPIGKPLYLRCIRVHDFSGAAVIF